MATPKKSTSKTTPSKTAATGTAEGRTGNVDPARPGRFDLAALVEGKMKPYRIIRVTTHPELAGRLDGALQALSAVDDALAAQTNPTPEVTKAMRMASKIVPAAELTERREAIEAQVADLYQEFDAEEWIEVRFDQIGKRRKEQVRRQVADDADGKPLDLDIMLAYCAECGTVREASDDPDRGEDEDWEALTTGQWETLLDAIGQTQADRVDTACGEMLHGGMVTADFSRRLSAYQATLPS